MKKTYAICSWPTYTSIHPHLHTLEHTLEHNASFSDTKITFSINALAITHCCDPREQASCACARAVTPPLIINQWANCKRTQSSHMTSPMHVNIHGVYKLFKVLGWLQYSWLIITDGWHSHEEAHLTDTEQWYRQIERGATGLGPGIMNWQLLQTDCLKIHFRPMQVQTLDNYLH